MDIYQQCVQAFHKKMEIDFKEDWKPADGTLVEMGARCADMAQVLERDLQEAGTTVPVLRAHLILEEVSEYLLAKTEEEALDALADLTYVVLGTAVTHDWPLEYALAEVHKSNMTKERQRKDPLGDRVRQKGEGYQPPSIKSLINAYREGKLKTPSSAVLGAIHDQFFNGTIKVDTEMSEHHRDLLETTAAAMKNPALKELVETKLTEVKDAYDNAQV